MNKNPLTILMVLMTTVASAAVTTNYVDCAYTGGDSDGSKEKPWTTMEDGLEHLTASRVLLVAPGRYRPARKLTNSKQHCQILATSDNPRDTVIDGGLVSERLLKVHAVGVVLSGFTVTNAFGGILQDSGITTNCVVTGCVISNLTAAANLSDCGAGISMKGGSLYDTTVENCRVELWGTGTGDVRGGGIYINLEVAGERWFRNVTVSNCALVARSTSGAGGKSLRGAGIDTINANAILHLQNCRIADNRISDRMTGWGQVKGCAACLGKGSMEDSVIVGNTGGSIFEATSLAVTNCTFARNEPISTGSGIALLEASDVRESLFEANTNLSNNSGLLALGGSTRLRRSVLKGNAAIGFKYAGLYLSGTDNLVEECVFEDNATTSSGAAISANKVGMGVVQNCVFRRQGASGGDGGALFYGSTKNTGTAGDAMVVRNCLFEGCVSSKNLIFVTGAYADSRIAFESCTFLTNSCTKGFVACSSGKDFLDYTSFANCLFAANTIGEAGEPALSPDNYWTDSLAAAKFADIDNGNLHPKSSSPAAKRGVKLTWMSGATDLGTLTWSRTGTGVSVSRSATMPRVGKEDAVDCGCYSVLNPGGLVLVIR